MHATRITGRIAALAALAALWVTACDGPTPARGPTGPRPSASAPTTDTIVGRFPIASGRSLAIDCAGAGALTIVLEVGFDAAGIAGEWRMQSLRNRLTPRFRVCNYDRANLGHSDPAPTPRTTGDLAALLAAARVSGRGNRPPRHPDPLNTTHLHQRAKRRSSSSRVATPPRACGFPPTEYGLAPAPPRPNVSKSAHTSA